MEVLKNFYGHKGDVMSLAISIKNDLFVIGSIESTAKVCVCVTRPPGCVLESTVS